MTVGHELEKITDLKLFHNHMTIELLAPYFGFSHEMWGLVNKFRQDIFETAAASHMYGMIFTYVWGFDLQGDWDYVEKICKIFEDQGAEVYFVELEADLEERIERNKTPHRLEHKPTKRDIVRSEQDRSMEWFFICKEKSTINFNRNSDLKISLVSGDSTHYDSYRHHCGKSCQRGANKGLCYQKNFQPS